MTMFFLGVSQGGVHQDNVHKEVVHQGNVHHGDVRKGVGHIKKQGAVNNFIANNLDDTIDVDYEISLKEQATGSGRNRSQEQSRQEQGVTGGRSNRCQGARRQLQQEPRDTVFCF